MDDPLCDRSIVMSERKVVVLFLALIYRVKFLFRFSSVLVG